MGEDISHLGKRNRGTRFGNEQTTITVLMSITGVNKERKEERENEGELMKKKKERNKERKKERKKE